MESLEQLYEKLQAMHGTIEEKAIVIKELAAYIDGQIEPSLEGKSIELIDKARNEYAKREAVLAISIHLLEKIEERECKLDKFLRNVEQYIADKVVNEKSDHKSGAEIWRQNSVR